MICLSIVWKVGIFLSLNRIHELNIKYLSPDSSNFCIIDEEIERCLAEIDDDIRKAEEVLVHDLSFLGLLRP